MIFAAILSLAAVAVAVPVDNAAAQLTGRAHIFNRCSFDVNYWINNQGPHVLPAGGNWGEDFDPSGASRTITVMTSPRLYSADPKVLMGYTYVPEKSTVYYDLYSGDGTTSPFQGFKVLQSSADSGCAANVWPNGVQVPGNHVQGCRSDRDVNLWLCKQ
jgi:hypothetical protein